MDLFLARSSNSKVGLERTKNAQWNLAAKRGREGAGPYLLPYDIHGILFDFTFRASFLSKN